MTYTAPQQMFAHCLNYLKGWFEAAALDFAAKLSSTVDNTATPYGGRVLHLNSSGAFEMGAKGIQMPIFAHQGWLENDVANYGGAATSPYGWQSIAPTGVQSGLVAKGAYELATTEFYQADGVAYAPNDLLKAPTEDQITGADKSAAGMLFGRKYWPGGGNATFTLGTDSFCGQVSRGIMPPEYNHRTPALALWPIGWYGTGNS
jgi:hypothetical protein